MSFRRSAQGGEEKSLKAFCKLQGISRRRLEMTRNIWTQHQAILSLWLEATSV